MKTRIAAFCLGLGLMAATSQEVAALPLRPVAGSPATADWGRDEQLWGSPGQSGDRWALIGAIDRSLAYLKTPSAAKAYQHYPVPGVTRERVRRTLLRFRELLKTSPSPEALQAAVQREFVFYESVGRDGQGTVQFTGYFQPIYAASRKPTAEYRYPLYRQPRDFRRWSKPHPTRAELEGEDGLLGQKSPLSGYELVWLRDRLEAFLVHVQGSAKLQLPDGTVMTVGVEGNTDYPYTSIGKQLIEDGVFKPEELTLPVLLDYFQKNPQQLDRYLPRNRRFIFFRETRGAPATGSLGLPVTAERSIATDKSLMPPGALALIETEIPSINGAGEMEILPASRYVLDHDTGSAIKGPGRVDIFMGTGKIAGDRAGLIRGTGKLYYLLLKSRDRLDG